MRRLAVLAVLVVASLVPLVAGAQGSGTSISGTVRMGAVPLPGVAITLASAATGQKYVTSSDDQGKFVISVLHPGTYALSADMAGFTSVQRSVVVSSTGPAIAPLVIELGFADSNPQRRAAATTPQTGRRGAGRAGAANNGYQTTELNADAAVAGADFGSADTADTAPESGGIAGMNTDTATESVAVNGSFNNDNRALGQGDLQAQLAQLGLGPAGGLGAPGSDVFTGGGGGPGGGGGFAGRGGGGFGGGGRGGG
ncbi:MAG TPA: carboxypeptidase-like regulatory domain-containing protein, partial [Terriglobales bacterium]|nr:carboxypeptidase-like regulatory domain-containing protein [Terriglobales bacterium]